MIRLTFIAFLLLAFPLWAQEEEPPLPEGLGQEEEEPELPMGLEGEEKPAEEEEQEGFKLPVDLWGFLDGRLGYRTHDDPYEKRTSIAELRYRLDIEKDWDTTIFKFAGDFVVDYYNFIDHTQRIDLKANEGWFQLRELNLAFTPADFTDWKVGRQILTWGTGDLLFVNDLFPKDWQSFFLGRDVEYLKFPSNALKGSFYSDHLDFDLVYTPQFDPDNYVSGARLSYYNSLLGDLAGSDAVIDADAPDRWFTDDEVALRLYKTLSGVEFALYGYNGFWKVPVEFDPAAMNLTFPKLAVAGASARGNVASGIGNVELGYYYSRDDSSGKDPLVANSEFRFLTGYEQEIATELTMGLQYYLEWLQDYDNYKNALLPGSEKRDEYRHVLTIRLTKMLLNQNLKLSLFNYFSPSEIDGYARAFAQYKFDDYWYGEVGGNFFYGKDDHTFFGQFENNSNIYVALRWSF